MKANKLFVIGAGLLYLTSCTKDENVQNSTFSNADHQLSTIEMVQFENKDEYQDQIAHQSAFFEAIHAQNANQESALKDKLPEITMAQFESGDYDVELVKEISTQYVNEFIGNEVSNHQKFVNEFPAYRNVNNVYNKYIEVLQANDMEQWNALVKEYPNFFMVLNNSFLIPTHANVLNANMNLNGEYKVGADLVRYHEKGYSTFENYGTDSEVRKDEIYVESSRRGYINYKVQNFLIGPLAIGVVMRYDRLAYFCHGPYPHKYLGQSLLATTVNGIPYYNHTITLTDNIKTYLHTIDYTTTVHHKTGCVNSFTSPCYTNLFHRNLTINYKFDENTGFINHVINTNGYN